MWLLLLSGLAPLLRLAGADDPVPKYMLVLPARLSYPSREKLCMDLSDVQTPVVLNVTLETKNTTQVLLDRFNWRKKQFTCFTFPVPAPVEGPEEVAAIRLSDTTGKINETKQVLIERAANSTFVQTDKPIYSPGQLVNFRIFTLDSEFMAAADEYQLVELQDPEGNRIAQWDHVKPNHGIVQLSFQLIAEPILGTYMINVDNWKGHSDFQVVKYVPPKFEVKVVEPTTIFSADSNFHVNVCGSYTYGKSVRGSVQVSLCQIAYQHYWRSPNSTAPAPKDICRNYTGQTDGTGCFSASVELSQFKPGNYDYSQSIDMEAIFKEAGTGVQANVTHHFYMSDEAGTMHFVDADNYYHPGYPFKGKLKAWQRGGSVLQNHEVFLIINVNNSETNQLLVTDSRGVADFTLETDAWSGNMVFLAGKFQLEDPVYEPGKVNQYYQNAYLTLNPYYTTTKSYVKIQRLVGVLPCNQKQEVQVDYSISESDLGEKARGKGVLFSYYVTGKGKLLDHGQENVNSKSGALKGSFSILLNFNSDFAPKPSLVVYSRFPDGGLVADKTDFELSQCFKNQVSLGFPQEQEVPGSKVNLELKATPGSWCAVRAVDQSVLLFRKHTEISNETVYNRFYFPRGHPYQVSEYNTCDSLEPTPDPAPLERRKRFSWRPGNVGGVDFFGFLRAMGLKVLSNNKIKKPVACKHNPFHRHSSFMASEAADFREPLSSGWEPHSFRPDFGSAIRQFFPETWIWDLYRVDDSGEKQVRLTVPDSLTEWKASTFCISQSSGFGMSSTVGLTVFKPFFVDLKVPYSVIRGESFPLIATVFNYLKHCIRIQIALSKSEEYQVESCKGCEYSSCLCASETKTYSWNVKATKLGKVNFTVAVEALNSRELCGSEPAFVPEKGRSDTLVKPLLVQPEGVLVEKSYSSLLCPKGGSASDAFSLQLPEDVVEDSARAQVSVLGDIMGTALQNLDKLVQMPSGCGEQNMVLFAPIVYVLQSLESTGQLNEELKTKALGYLQSGYQRQLNYKHSDGSYSAFGKADEQGNTWLTAFVTKIFIQAEQYMKMDEQITQDALTWLASNQQANGRFANVGKLFHTAMKGGVNDDVSHAAYITAALLEAKKQRAVSGEQANLFQQTLDPMVTNGLDYLRTSASNTTDVYAQALLAYVFSLAGDTAMRHLLLDKLDRQAIRSGGQIHWSRKPAPASSQDPWSHLDALSVELSAYALLATLTVEPVSKGDLAKATGMVAWLAKQQNAYGGFASTQDTVVALQALARYGTVTCLKSGDLSIAVKSKQALLQSFHVDDTNRLVLQQAALPDLPGEYVVEASGKGCGYVQAVLRYNMPPPKNAETFTLDVKAGGKGCDQETAPRYLSLNVSVSYVGSRGISNMAIILVKILSGFHPVQGTDDFLKQQAFVKRVEIEKEHLTIYLDQLEKEKQTYTFTMSQDIPVKDLKPAAVKVYDYYQPDEQATVEYKDPCQ